MFDYLATATNELGSYAWTFLILQGVALLAGIYLLAINKDPHPVRGPLLQRLGIALAVFGSLGVLFGVARPLNLGPLTLRWWFYGLAIVELLFAAYVFYFARSVYPERMAEYRASTRSRRPGTRPTPRPGATPASNGTPITPAPPRPEAMTSRRAARRERKRRR